MTAGELRSLLRRALHATDAPPQADGWNAAEIADLLDDLQKPAEAAVLAPIILREEPTLLLTRRCDALTHHAGQISFPGGRLESDDVDAIAGALRESHEEIGLAPAAVEPLGFLDPLTTITGFRVLPVVGLVAPGARIDPDPREVAEVFEVPLAFVLDAVNQQQRSREFRGRVRRYHVIEFGNYEIWGATAAMIVNLSDRMRAAGWTP
jgi:8-oxo-dGTP pyrophosphatase MutT (NUDIX family)